MSEESLSKFERGVAIVRPYIHIEGGAKKPVDEDLETGIALLESCADDLWEANWMLGKAHEAKGEFVESAIQFGFAFQKEPERVAVIHELLIALLRINEKKKAQQIARHFASSNDPLLTFDLALVEFTFPDAQEAALNILDSFDWPREFSSRVSELRARIRDVSANATDSNRA